MVRVGHPCGLCNRIDVIVSGYLLAEVNGESNIEVRWPLNVHMPVRLHDLFTDLPSGQVVDEAIDPEFWRDYSAALSRLGSDYRDSPSYRRTLNGVLSRVAADVLADVSTFVARHFQQERGPVVGVHVRRSEGSSRICPHAQPLRYYEAAMKSCPAETRFFISTDSQQAFSWLQKKFGERVFQRPKSHDNRVDLHGIREGLIDMMLLSHCRLVIGTHRSSFSHLAALAGGCPILFVRAWPRIPADWPSFSRLRWLWAHRHVFVEGTIWRRSFDWSVYPFLRRLGGSPATYLRRLWGSSSTVPGRQTP